jgi:hypothetical protein
LGVVGLACIALHCIALQEKDQLGKCLSALSPKEAIIDKILSVPKLVSLIRRKLGPSMLVVMAPQQDQNDDDEEERQPQRNSGGGSGGSSAAAMRFSYEIEKMNLAPLGLNMLCESVAIEFALPLPTRS